MHKKFNLREMLEEIRENEAFDQNGDRSLVSQDEIQKMLDFELDDYDDEVEDWETDLD